MPSNEGTIIPKGASITISGEIHSETKLSDKVTFKCELFDEKRKLVRYTATHIKADKNICVSDDLTLYPNGVDDDLSELKNYGFAEILGDEKASSKAYFDDHKYRTFIYSAGNTSCGAVFDDGLNLKDDDGKDLVAFDKGNYVIKVSLVEEEKEIATYERKITVGSYSDTLICRVNPIEHKLNMFKWAKENKLAAWVDDLPGYLTPYHNGLWFYHMGLLPFYRANDICLYKEGRVHMFIYETAADSTSYKTEYAYLQKCGVIDDKKRFIPYIYDIGETKVKERIGKIIELKEDIHLYRIDNVKEAKENIYNLDGRNVIRSEYENFRFNVGEEIAIAGVIKPYQMDRDDFILGKDNTYEIKNEPSKLIYKFISGEKTKTYERELNMLRIKGDKTLERSVFEFYNLFNIDESFAGKTWEVEIQLKDRKGNVTGFKRELSLEII